MQKQRERLSIRIVISFTNSITTAKQHNVECDLDENYLNYQNATSDSKFAPHWKIKNDYFKFYVLMNEFPYQCLFVVIS